MKKFKKTLRQFRKKLRPIIVIPAVLVVGLIVAGILIFGGGGDDTDTGPNAQRPVLTPEDLKSGKFKPKRSKQAPRGTTGVIDEARREGRLVLAQARGTVLKPGRIRLRISAAPKQTITVDWQLGCYRNRKVKLGRGKYRARTPDIRQIPISMPGAESCIATATAGLTKVDGKGRVKVAIIAG